MDLGSPLRSLIPSLDSAVLETLAGTESSLSMSQIGRLAGRGTRQGLNLVVERLVEHGIVIADPANRGNLYRLNREHVLADAILSACSARSTIFVRLVNAVRGLMPQPVHASIFGSFARREAGQASDIDVLLILSEDAEIDDQWFAAMRKLAEDVFAWTGNRLEYLVFTESELRDLVVRNEAIVHSWLDDSVVLLGASLDSMVSALQFSSRNVQR